MIVTTQSDSAIVVLQEPRYMELLTAEDKVNTIRQELDDFISELVREVAIKLETTIHGGNGSYSGSFKIKKYKVDFIVRKNPEKESTVTYKYEKL